MVPANADHTTGNESQKNTSTLRTFFERLKFWKRDKKEKEEEEPAQLTPMPAWLMHWWTPLLVAAIFFAPSLICAIIWGGQPHWPSSKAMKLCMTITGAGLAFSAWQQRSHDNTTNAKQARAAIERDDYWKRREHIYQLLGSKNPGLRLSAVALLAELADSAAHSTLLNETEKQQLQRHIIDTLCLQIRHEGLEQTEEGNRDEHREIQKAIIETLLKRINKPNKISRQADWSQLTISMTNCKIYTPIAIHATTTESILDFSETHFYDTFTIKNSTLKDVRWHSAHFHQKLVVGDEANTVQIQIDNLPQDSKYTLFDNTCFTSNSGLIPFVIMPKEAHQPRTLINNCSFFHKTCLCSQKCSCRRSTGSQQCRCLSRNHCTCSTKCVNADVILWDVRLPNYAISSEVNIIFDRCRFNKFSIKLGHAHSSVTVYQSQFSQGLLIELEDYTEKETKIAYPDQPTNILSIEQCAFMLPIAEPCINLKVLTRETITIPVNFLNNSILAPYTYDQNIQDTFFKSYPNSAIPGVKIPLVCERDTENPELLHFEHTLSTDDHEICSPWTTGRIQSTSQD